MLTWNAQTEINDDFEGSLRFLNACKRVEIKTIGSLAAYGSQQFQLIKNCGYRTTAEARTILREAGLRFQDEVELVNIERDIQLNCADVGIAAIEPETCSDCNAPATHYIEIDLRAIGTTVQLGNDLYCQAHAEETLEVLRASLPAPINEDGTFEKGGVTHGRQ